MQDIIKIGQREVGKGRPCYIIGEIGINHNGDLDIAKKLIDTAAIAGCDAVKFQKRTPELCVPAAQRDMMRDTPWGRMTYLDYRYRVEFGDKEYSEIDTYCKSKGVAWFASCWDIPSVDFVAKFQVPCHKLASATITNIPMLKHIAAQGVPVILSTGMSSMEEIKAAVACFDKNQLIIAHSTSTYPCKPSELNLRMIHTLEREFDCLVGYSGHETGLQTTCAAVVLGACCVERHITLDRAMWGSDHAASLEPMGLMRLVRDIRVNEEAMGDGVKKVYDSEKPILQRLRNV